MTLTRLAFFKLLAAVGIGQAVTLRPPKGNTGLLKAGPSQDSPRWNVVKREDGTDCRAYDYVGADSKGNYVCIPEQCEPKLGEERCPLGHCQKPKYLTVPLGSMALLERPQETIHHKVEPITGVYPLPLPFVEPQPWDESFMNPHVCSVCGIVFVPLEKK